MNANATAPAKTTNSQRIVVSLKDRELAPVDNGVVKAVYPVAAGKRSTPRPTRTYTIVNHAGRWNPVEDR